MEFKEAVSNAHRIAEDISNYAIRDELANLWNCIIDNIETLREALDVICKHYQEDKWTLTSEKMPKSNELVWVCDKHHEVGVCQLHEYMDSDWYDSNDEWFYYRDSVIAWRPYLVPEPYEPEEVVKDGWHPASEEPPKVIADYLVQFESSDDSDGDGYAGMRECHWTDTNVLSGAHGFYWHWNGVPPYTRVKAWRPLPEKYTSD